MRFLLVCFAFALAALPAAAQLAPPITYAEAYDADRTGYASEVRGVWITNVDSDLLTSRESIAEGMDYLASRGYNVIFPVVWNKAYTLYPSEVMVETFGASRRQDPAYTSQGRDPLQEVIEEAHLRGMEVMAWFEYGFAASFSQDGGFIIQQKPDWAAIGTDGNIVTKNGFDWMNGLHPGPQKLLTDLVLEVVTKYDVDGIQGDDRLPAMPTEAGYSATTRALYAADFNGADVPSSPRNRSFQEWRADKLTEWLGTLYAAVKEVDEDLVMSLSPSIFPFSFNEYLQDWPEWIDRGFVDLIHPQAYRRNFASYRALAQFMPGAQVPRDSTALILAPGVLSKAGGTLMNPNDARAIAEWNRENDFAGEVWFFYEGMRERNRFLADTLRRYVYTRPAILPIRGAQLWRPEAEIVHENAPDAVRTGAWSVATGPHGYRGGVLTTTSEASLSYPIRLPGAGTYDVYAYALPGYDGSATYTIEHADGSSDALLDLNTIGRTGWVSLGQYAFGTEGTITLRSGDGGTFAADAVTAVLNRKETESLTIGLPTTNEVPEEALHTGAGTLAVRAYPNPARSSATVTFVLDAPAEARVTLYDALGREARTIPLRRYGAGEQSAALDLGGLAPGVYFARVEAGAVAATRALVVTR